MCFMKYSNAVKNTVLVITDLITLTLKPLYIERFGSLRDLIMIGLGCFSAKPLIIFDTISFCVSDFTVSIGNTNIHEKTPDRAPDIVIEMAPIGIFVPAIVPCGVLNPSSRIFAVSYTEKYNAEPRESLMR